MDIVRYNFSWMMFNLLLASLPVYLAFLFGKTRGNFLRVIIGSVWLLFVPNTIYVLTDLVHLERQLPRVSDSEVMILFLQYVVFEFLGIACFILAIFPIEKALFGQLKSFKQKSIYFIVSLNFLIAFGVTLGRFQRTHSWYLLTDFPRVVDDIMQILTSPVMLLFILFFGITTNAVYFLFRRPLLKMFVSSTKKT